MLLGGLMLFPNNLVLDHAFEALKAEKLLRFLLQVIESLLRSHLLSALHSRCSRLDRLIIEVVMLRILMLILSI